MAMGNTRYFAHPDRMGSTTALTSGGVVTDRFSYDAFGNELSHTGTTPTPFRYEGQSGYRQGVANNLYLLQQRYYRVSIGRFQTVDPGCDDPNYWIYASNGPAQWYDPDGMRACNGDDKCPEKFVCTSHCCDFSLNHSRFEWRRGERMGRGDGIPPTPWNGLYVEHEPFDLRNYPMKFCCDAVIRAIQRCPYKGTDNRPCPGGAGLDLVQLFGGKYIITKGDPEPCGSNVIWNTAGGMCFDCRKDATPKGCAPGTEPIPENCCSYCGGGKGGAGGICRTPLFHPQGSCTPEGTNPCKYLKELEDCPSAIVEKWMLIKGARCLAPGSGPKRKRYNIISSRKFFVTKACCADPKPCGCCQTIKSWSARVEAWMVRGTNGRIYLEVQGLDCG